MNLKEFDHERGYEKLSINEEEFSLIFKSRRTSGIWSACSLASKQLNLWVSRML